MPLELQLVPVVSQLLRMASEEGFLGDAAHSEERLIEAAITGYQSKGYRTWTIHEALCQIVEPPESDLTASLTQCLEQWFFIEKLSPPQST